MFGHPLRAVIPGHAGVRNAKWINSGLTSLVCSLCDDVHHLNRVFSEDSERGIEGYMAAGISLQGSSRTT
jgi:DMSO/TMAO reductase YedYZ molybdopterin-dependent catalytic subunit